MYDITWFRDLAVILFIVLLIAVMVTGLILALKLYGKAKRLLDFCEKVQKMLGIIPTSPGAKTSNAGTFLGMAAMLWFVARAIRKNFARKRNRQDKMK